ncbi:MAG: aggregation factor core [Pseudomonadota bacterium]
MRFTEGAPKDRFTLTNTGGCDLPAMTVTLDIGASPAGLIFDVTAQGAGVEVFQPFELVAGAALLREMPKVTDGDAAIVLALHALAPGQGVAFTIDVDDTGGAREITVNGSEIAGAEVSATLAGKTRLARFTDQGTALLPTPPCVS